MLMPLLFAALVGLHQAPPPAGEPDGSRTVGIVPPFHAEPTPPDWLRATSHALAAVDTRHYIYEVYAGSDGTWLVRYLMLPESGEAFREVEQVFRYGSDPMKKPTEVVPSEVNFDNRSATWKKSMFKLVDRRDLMKP